MKKTIVGYYRFYKRYIQIVGVLIAFVGLSFAIAQIPTDTLVDYIGSENAWLLMFVLGAIGGISTFVTVPYQVVLMSFASAGINPIVLGIATALGVMVGDSTMFLLSKQVQGKLSQAQQERLDSWSEYFAKHPRLVAPSLVLYGTFSPLSNDFVVAGLSLMNFNYLRIVVPLTIGNIFYNIANVRQSQEHQQMLSQQ